MWRTLHAWAAILWVAAIIVQVFLAGQTIANLGGSGDFTTHIGFGYMIGIVQLVVLILAFPARMSGRDRWISTGILGLYIVQTLLPGLKSVSPLISALPGSSCTNRMVFSAPRTTVGPCAWSVWNWPPRLRP